MAASIREVSVSPARSARATATLFALGSLLTLVDALLTRTLLNQPGTVERWVPVRLLMQLLGVDVALVVSSTLAVLAMAVVAWGAVRARSSLATVSFVVLSAVVLVRIWGCVNNFGILLH
jgi:hypothetical protein